ncbi:hypothetical protein AL047_22445 [Pseudomonas syringae pv. broussonetiae]|nr:hypothetical protein AL047_22445 [Pseudomonas syringae pv. broussonetiae]
MEVRTVKAQLDCPPLKINGAPAPLRQLIEDFENDLHHIGDFTYAYFSTPKTRNVKPVILSNYPDSWLKSYGGADLFDFSSLQRSGGLDLSGGNSWVLE